MVPFPLLISLNTKMSLEAGGEQGRGALFPILALPLWAGPPGACRGCVTGGRTDRQQGGSVRCGEGCRPHACARPLWPGV